MIILSPAGLDGLTPGVWAFIVIANLIHIGFWVGIAYIAIHFIRKAW
jgi:hypothetical protein